MTDVHRTRSPRDHRHPDQKEKPMTRIEPPTRLRLTEVDRSA